MEIQGDLYGGAQLEMPRPLLSEDSPLDIVGRFDKAASPALSCGDGGCG